ncbi:hypothetical protein [Microbacterium sp. B19]|uniref:hypothetical protein n=1 Tax=Microbacterium sp. B19 TaxID=96765 RepID=UPI0003494D2D|nr:hypothetical protein [Microbacterium sp. B19]
MNEGRGARSIGALISSILLAGGEANVPLAVTGKADANDGSGDLLVIYPDIIVTVTASDLHANTASITTRLIPAAAATDLQVETKHSYYDGTSQFSRTRGFAFTFAVGRETFRLEASRFGYRPGPLVGEDAMYAAFRSIRDRAAATGA